MDTKTRPLYMLSTRDPPQNKGHIQTKSEGLEKNISRKRRPKESKYFLLEGKVLIFFDKQNLGQFITSRPALQKVLKQVHGTESKETKKDTT